MTDLITSVGAELAGNAWVAVVLIGGMYWLWPCSDEDTDEYDGIFEGADDAYEAWRDEQNGVRPCSVRKGRAVRSFGENHRSARLTANVVADLRSNAPYSYGDYSRLGREYGCTSNAIRRAVLGITWRHL